MAVLATKDGGQNVTDTFYKVEQSNPPGRSGQSASLGGVTPSPAIVPLTFTSASANCKGGIFILAGSISAGAQPAASTYHDVSLDLQEIQGAVTVDASTDVITRNSHGFSDGDRVSFSAATIPTGLVAGQVYFVRDQTANTFKVSATSGGTAINITANGTTVVVWLTRTYDQQTGADLFNNRTYHRGYHIVDFPFDTPYAIDNTASKWRFVLCRHATQTNAVSYYLSATSNPAVHAAYTDATASAATVTAAAQTLTFTNQPATGETIVIDGHTMTFRTNLDSYSYFDNVVKIGATLADSIKNLYDAINGDQTNNRVNYSIAKDHPTVTATAYDATTITVTAKKWAYGVNTIPCTETIANASWGAATLTGATAGDTVWVRTPLTINADCGFSGSYGAGDTAVRYAMIVCKNTDPTPANVALLRWSGAGSYTMAVDGAICIGTHSGVRIGTAASPISITNMATLGFPVPSATSALGILHFGATYNSGNGSSLFMQGEYLDNDSSLLTEDVVAYKTIQMDYSGVPDVVTISTGSGLSTEEHDALMGIETTVDTNLDAKVSEAGGSLTTEEHDQLMKTLTKGVFAAST